VTQRQASYKAVKSGDQFEQQVIATNKKYALQRIGAIEKIPTGTKAIPTGRGVRWIPAEKTGCDFIGHYKGVPVALEAKSTVNKTAFPLFVHGKAMVKHHQLAFLKRYEASGGRSYVLIHFKAIRRTFRVPVGKYMKLTESATQANKKSLNIKLFEAYEVDIKDYLKGVNDNWKN
jgi:recombination protein U